MQNHFLLLSFPMTPGMETAAELPSNEHKAEGLLWIQIIKKKMMFRGDICMTNWAQDVTGGGQDGCLARHRMPQKKRSICKADTLYSIIVKLYRQSEKPKTSNLWDGLTEYITEESYINCKPQNCNLSTMFPCSQNFAVHFLKNYDPGGG